MLQSPCIQQLQFSPFFNLNSTGERGRARKQGVAGAALCVFVQQTVKTGSNENAEFLSFPCYLKNCAEIFNKAPHEEDSLSGELPGWPGNPSAMRSLEAASPRLGWP